MKQLAIMNSSWHTEQFFGDILFGNLSLSKSINLAMFKIVLLCKISGLTLRTSYAGSG